MLSIRRHHEAFKIRWERSQPNFGTNPPKLDMDSLVQVPNIRSMFIIYEYNGTYASLVQQYVHKYVP